MKKLAVIGNPITHSLSPKLHKYWLEENNIDAIYKAKEFTKDNFSKSFKELFLKDYLGVNITIPFKEKVMDEVDIIEDVALKIGAVNTVFKNQDNKLVGTNTDAYGFIENIKLFYPDFNFKKKKALVIGAGGAAKAVLYGLLEEGLDQIKLVNRTIQRAENLANIFGNKILVEEYNKLDDILDDIDILINTTSLGMINCDKLEINLDKLPKDALVTDIVYNPLQTQLLIAAKNRGNKIVDGLGMLLHQGALSFYRWFNVKPIVNQKLRDYILS